MRGNTGLGFLRVCDIISATSIYYQRFISIIDVAQFLTQQDDLPVHILQDDCYNILHIRVIVLLISQLSLNRL